MTVTTAHPAKLNEFHVKDNDRMTGDVNLDD